MGLNRPGRCGARWAVLLLACCGARAQETLPDPSADLGDIYCTATATVPLVRLEGTSELVGDILLTCYNSGAVTAVTRPFSSGFLEADVRLSLNVAVGNRVGTGGALADAVLVVNGKDCPASGAARTFASCGHADRTVQDPMLAYRDSSQRGTLTWRGVAIPIPGAPTGADGGRAAPVADCSGRYGLPGGCHPRATTIRLTNIRANASELGASGEPTAVAIPIEASLDVAAPGATVRIEGGLLRVAEAAAGLKAGVRSPVPERLCSHGETVSEVAVSEGFATAFKTRGVASDRPGDPGWDEAFYRLAADGFDPDAGLAGTRIRVALAGLPAGVSVFAPTRVACAPDGLPGTLELRLVEGASASGLGGSLAGSAGGERSMLASEDFGARAVYEVTQADPLVREECSIPIRFERTDLNARAAFGSRVVLSVGLAPAGPPSPGGRGDYGQRFVNVNRRGRPRIDLVDCGTTLFFPFVTSRTNFDTGVVIANTSADPLGTRHESGQCILRYHGSRQSGQPVEPSIQRSASVQPGKQLAFTVSSGSPANGLAPLAGFQGYLVAECEFRHAHGFAFVTEQVNGAAILAQGYLAEIVHGEASAGASAGPP